MRPCHAKVVHNMHERLQHRRTTGTSRDCLVGLPVNRVSRHPRSHEAFDQVHEKTNCRCTLTTVPVQ